jgi:hypothetical protein
VARNILILVGRLLLSSDWPPRTSPRAAPLASISHGACAHCVNTSKAETLYTPWTLMYSAGGSMRSPIATVLSRMRGSASKLQKRLARVIILHAQVSDGRPAESLSTGI